MSDFILSGYQITNPPIGEGCTGEVYLAKRHQEMSRQLVAKHYRAMAVDRDELARNYKKFSQMPPCDEIVDLVEFQMEATPYYSIFEYVEGETLDRRPMLKEQQAWQVVKKLVNAIGHAHKFGVIHGNLHPGNILFTEELQSEVNPLPIKVTDFGVGLCGQFHHVDVFDNGFFNAPEQLLSQGKDFCVVAAKKWDVYSFGVLAYWLLTDHFPRGEEHLLERTNESLKQGGKAEPIDPVELGRSLQSEQVRSWGRKIGGGEKEQLWLEVINQCLELDPERRPVDMREVKNRFLEVDSNFKLIRARANAENSISELEESFSQERDRQRSQLFSARFSATILALSCLAASYLVVMFVKNAMESRTQIYQLDKVVETQKESLTEMDRSISETARFLRQSRKVADDSFYKLTQQVGSRPTLTELEQSRHYYQKVMKEVEGDTSRLEEYARAVHSLAHIENLMSRKSFAAISFEMAIDAFDQAIEHSQSPGGKPVADDTLLRLADCYEYIGLLSDSSSTKEGYEATAKAIEYFRQVLQQNPSDKESALRLATICFRYGRYLYANNEFDAAIHAYSDSATQIQEYRDLGSFEGDTSELDKVVAHLQYHAAQAFKEEARDNEAINSYIAAIESAERLRSLEGYGNEVGLLMARSFVALGDIFDQTGDIGDRDKDQVYNEALRLISPIFQESPEDVTLAVLQCKILSRLADLERRNGNPKDGYQLSLRGIEALLKALEKEPTNLDGFMQLAESRLSHLQFLKKDAKIARTIVLRGVDTAKHAHNLVAANETEADYQYRGRLYDRLRRIFDGYGEMCKELGQSRTASECLEYATFKVSQN